MSHIVGTTLAPFAECDVVARFNGPDSPIPMVEIGFDSAWHSAPAVTITLGNCADPAFWLRTTAERLVALAEDVEALAIDETEVS